MTNGIEQSMISRSGVRLPACGAAGEEMAMAESWTSQTMVVVPIGTAQRLCAPGVRRGGVAATLAQRGEQSTRMVAWAAPGAPGGTRPIGTFVVRWPQPAVGEAELGELCWLPSHDEDELWCAIEELAGHALPR